MCPHRDASEHPHSPGAFRTVCQRGGNNRGLHEWPSIPGHLRDTCLSAINGVNQAFARFTPFFTPKNVKLGVFVFFKILQKNVNYKAIGISMDWQNEPL